MSEIKLVLTDFDGTVAEAGTHVVSDVVRKAVIACEENDVRMAPVTGRPHIMAQSVLGLLGFDGLGVFDNGATVQNCVTGEIVWTKWMDPELVKKVAAICAPMAHVISYTDVYDEHVPADNEVELIERSNQPAPHVYALLPLDRIDDIKNKLDQLDGITYYTAVSTKADYPDALGIQVNHIEADKFHGVNALRRIVGISKEQTLAIGDGNNDIALFKNAGLRIAMGNATEMLKEHADHIVGTIQEDGFAEAMHKFVLNK